MSTAAPARPAGQRPDAAALLDALPDSAAVLDGTGTVIAVNQAWRMFALDNGGRPATTGVGVNYLDVCERAARAGCAEAADVRTGLRAVLAGDTVEQDVEYPCPSPTVPRWFALRATPIAGPERRVLVTHVNVTRRRLAELRLARQASVDPLTGLANRAMLDARLASALVARPGGAPQPDVGLVLVDLDGFKPVNDTYGSAAGDEVLQTVAARLGSLGRDQDTVCRVGGDTFALVAPGIDPDGLAALSTRVSAALTAPHRLHGDVVTVTASVGIHHATAGDDAAAALAAAQRAMCTVKRARRRR